VNDDVLAGRVIYDLSCRSGRDLGASAINQGAISFLGYTEDFWICLTNGEHPDTGMLDPLQDETARGFLESHNIAPISYINGSEIVDSYYASQNKFNYWISVWESIDTNVASYLMWNRDYQILHPFMPTPTVKAGVSPLIAFVPLLLVPLITKLK